MEKLLAWIDDRFPLTKVWEEHLSKYYAPKNFNFWYYFGSLALLLLVNQIVTGIFLTMHYKPDTALAFASVEYIMRDVEWGWLIRYLHSAGASLFFVVVYLHMFRGIIYGSHRKPRELIWLFGMLIFVALMAEAFMGYLLPWGNMSYWGAQVIISLFDAIPYVGPVLSEWIRGDFVVPRSTASSRCMSSPCRWCWWRWCLCTLLPCTRSVPTIRMVSRSRRREARTVIRLTAFRSIRTTR